MASFLSLICSDLFMGHGRYNIVHVSKFSLEPKNIDCFAPVMKCFPLVYWCHLSIRSFFTISVFNLP